MRDDRKSRKGLGFPWWRWLAWGTCLPKVRSGVGVFCGGSAGYAEVGNWDRWAG